MTVGSALKERRYSRKAGASFRRDKEHLALFEDLAMCEDLDTSLASMELDVPSSYQVSSQGDMERDVLDSDIAKNDDDWLVTSPEVPISPAGLDKSRVVMNRTLSNIRTSRNLLTLEEPVSAAVRRNSSIEKSVLKTTKGPRPSFSTSKSPRPEFSTSKSPRPSVSTCKSPRPSTTSVSASTLHSSVKRSTSSPRPSLAQKPFSPRLTTPIMRPASPSARSNSAGRATISAAQKSTPLVKSSSPTLRRASTNSFVTLTTATGRRLSSGNGNSNSRPSVTSNGVIASTAKGATKPVAQGTAPFASNSSSRGSSPARGGTSRRPSPSASTINSRGTSPARAGFNRGASAPSVSNISSSGSSPGRSSSSRKPSPTRVNISSLSGPNSLNSSRASSVGGRKPSPPKRTEKLTFGFDFLSETPANLRTSAFNKKGCASPGALISRSYDDGPSNRRKTTSPTNFQNYISKSQDRSPNYLSSSQDRSPNYLSRSQDRGIKELSRSQDRDSKSIARSPSGDFSLQSSQSFAKRRASTGDRQVSMRKVTVPEYGLDGRRLSKGNKEVPQSPRQSLGRSTTLQQDPAFENSLMRRSSDSAASRSLGYNGQQHSLNSSGGFKPFMTNSSIPSFSNSISSSLHRKLHQTESVPRTSISPPGNNTRGDLVAVATKGMVLEGKQGKDNNYPGITGQGKEESSNVDQKHTVKRTQMGFALKKGDINTINHAWTDTAFRPQVETKVNRMEVGTKQTNPALTSLVVGQGPVKIYQGLGDMEDMTGSWCCGMQNQYRSFCKQRECGIYKNFHDALVLSSPEVIYPTVSQDDTEDGQATEPENAADDPAGAVGRSPGSDGNASARGSGKSPEIQRAQVSMQYQMLESSDLSCEMRDMRTISAGDGDERGTLREENIVCELESALNYAAMNEVGRRKSTSRRPVEKQSPLKSPDVVMTQVFKSESATSEETSPRDPRTPVSSLRAEKQSRVKSEKSEIALKNGFNWDLEVLEASKPRQLKSPDFFDVAKRNGDGVVVASISRVQSFNASEYDEQERELAAVSTKETCETTGSRTPRNESRSDAPESNGGRVLAIEQKARHSFEGSYADSHSEKLREHSSEVPEGAEDIPEDHSPQVVGSNILMPESAKNLPRNPAKLFPFVKSPKDGYGGGFQNKCDVSRVSSTKSAISRISSTSATSIDLTRSIDTTCSTHSQYDNALWDDPNYSGRFGDPTGALAQKSITTVPLPAEVGSMDPQEPARISSEERVVTPESGNRTPRYNDGLEKLAGYMRSASLNARKRRVSLASSEADSKLSSRESSFDYFVDFLESQTDLDLEGCGLADALVSAHHEAKKTEFSPGTPQSLGFIKRLDSRLSNNSLISDKSYESRVTDISSEASWESGKTRGQTLETTCQVMEEILENANSLASERQLSSFKFGQKRTSVGERENITSSETGLESPISDYEPSASGRTHSKQLSNAASESSQKSALYFEDVHPLGGGHLLPALKSTPGIIIMSDKSLEELKALSSPPRSSGNDLGEYDGNLWEAVQALEEVKTEVEPIAPGPNDSSPKERTPSRSPSEVSNDSEENVLDLNPSNSKAPKPVVKQVTFQVDDIVKVDRKPKRVPYCGCTIL